MSEQDAYDPAAERDAVGGKADSPVPTKKWTLLFYGAGDNNLGDEIVTAVNTFESVGSTQDVNFLAFYDHSTLKAARVFLEKDDDTSKITSPGIQQLGDVDSGAPSTLTSFASWAINTYPAEHYALIIDSHGGTYPQQIAFDDGSNHAMSLTDLWQAVDYIAQRTHEKLDVLAGDTCLTQTVEQAYELRLDAKRIVMSENLDYGWDYGTIAKGLVARPGQTEDDLAKAMVAAYNPPADGSMSSVAPAHIATLADALDGLAGVVMSELQRDPSVKDQILQIASTVYRPYEGEQYADVIDLANKLIALNASPELTEAATTVKTAAQAVVRTSKHTGELDGANGITVFAPQTLDEDHLAEYRVSRFAHETTWDEMIAAVYGLE
ncbi:MAG TPA: clostripain-related cysteine peptidase [Kofleriaceae bacterium]